MKSRLLYALFSAVVLCSGYAYAAEDYGIQAGNSELAATIQSISSKSSAAGSQESTITMVYASYGYFWSKNLQIGAGLFISGQKAGSSDSQNTQISPFAKYHFFFDNPKYVPYVGASFLSGSAKSAGSTMTISGYELQGGVDVFIDRNVAIAFELGVGSQKYSTSGGGSTDYSSTAIRIPLKVYF
ncbi:MAG: hypothetical protein HZA03_10685 [Nitrospinae bacterium]|nr:hypothetical protein [Nitrospinota bacterium]